jgi:hypothetical protein
LAGVTSGDLLLDRQSKSVKSEFENDLRQAAVRALKRYPMPVGVDPSWKLTQQFVFSYVSQ